MLCTSLERPWNPPILLYYGYRVSFPGIRRPERVVNHPALSSAEVKERIELYLYFAFGSSWPVLGRILLYFICVCVYIYTRTHTHIYIYIWCVLPAFICACLKSILYEVRNCLYAKDATWLDPPPPCFLQICKRIETDPFLATLVPLCGILGFRRHVIRGVAVLDA